MKLIDRIKELKALEGRLQAIYGRQKDPRTPNHAILERIEIERKLLDVTPMLLDVLNEIRPGDADLLNGTIHYLIEDFEGDDHSVDMIAWSMASDRDMRKEMINCLRRYQAMAARMEAKGDE